MTESSAQVRVRLEAAELRAAMWRNNSGALLDKDGRAVRFGLGNDSKRLNDVWKSSDLIGIVPVVIGPQHVGKVLGVFAAAEMKDPATWRGVTQSDERAKAQANFIETVRNYGGIADFCTGPEDFRRMVEACRKG